MRVIRARNVNGAWSAALALIAAEGESRPSRNGSVLVHPEPVTTVYERPTERVLFDPVRDANPIFHLHEALWMLAGCDDATWLDRFVSDFSARFSEDGGRMHGAYGKRWRGWFRGQARQIDPTRPADEPQVWEFPPLDQLDEVVRLLRADPYDRQCVIQMWDASADLGVPGLKDRPCNTQIYLRCDRTIEGEPESGGGEPLERSVLDMTVTCRSNDIVYGCYGANAVHFSVLQEYLAARIGVGVGRYTQVSNNWHMYDWSLKNFNLYSAQRAGMTPYPGVSPLVTHPDSFDEEVRHYVEHGTDITAGEPEHYQNSFLSHTAHPMAVANNLRRAGQLERAIGVAREIEAPDWRQATVEWLRRRVKK